MADIKLQVGVKIFLKQDNLDIYVKEIINLGLIGAVCDIIT